jgi:glycosyltransferase involved in cell wall biosynthesis
VRPVPIASPASDAVHVLIVASWYPGVDDTARGRFVADQAEALFRTGLARPLVASFDPALADLGFVTRPASVGSVAEHRRAALTMGRDAVAPRAWGSEAGIPVSRVPVAEGPGDAASNDLQGELRRVALVDLVDRLARPERGVVHAHTAYPDGYAAADVARRLGWPLVITEHATFVQRQLRRAAQRRAYLAAVEAASRFVAVSEALAGELRESIPGIARKLEVVHNAVAIDDFTPTGMEGRRPEELLFIGYRRERKGIVTLLKAFANVLEERPKATLRLIGRSPTEAEERRWHELADELGVANAVSFEPPAHRSAIADAMARASLLAHASHRETFGITTVEALAAGLPVVAARAGGISDMLTDSRLGELVPPQDARYLARAILRTLARREEFDPAYLRAAAEPFAARRVADRLLGLYSEVLAETGPMERPSPVPTSDAVALSWNGRAEPLPAEVVVLAFNAERAQRALAPLPDDLLARLVVVTGGDAAGLPPTVGRAVDASADVERRLREVGLHGARGGIAARLRRLLRDPIGPIRRRLVPGGLYELRQRAVRAGILAAIERAGIVSTDGGSQPADLVCLDGIDYLAARPLVAAGRLRPTPGGLLWLADRYCSLQPAEVVAGE